MKDENITYVDQETWDYILEILANPPEPTEALKRLFSEPSPWEDHTTYDDKLSKPDCEDK